MSRSGYSILRERLDLLEPEHDDLLEQLRRSQEAARIMYRRGYLAGHSAGRRGGRPQGPYAKTRSVIG